MNTKAKSYILMKHMGTHMWVYYIQKCVTKMYIYATTQNECLDCRTANTATLNVSQAVLHILSRYIQKWATKMYMQLYFTWNVVLLCTHSSTLSLLHWRRQIFIRERWGGGRGAHHYFGLYAVQEWGTLRRRFACFSCPNEQETSARVNELQTMRPLKLCQWLSADTL